MARQGASERLEIAEPPGGEDLDRVKAWTWETFQKIKAISDLLAEGNIEVLHAEPSKPRTGRIVFADGTDWNPGSGRGVYVYDQNTPGWRFLG